VKTDKTGIWKQVLRGIGTTDLANLYNVHSYPTQYLIDKDGKIIANIELNNLESTLKQLMP
ncbi:MAG: alkyl hydroperoxide reductase, partial [Pseudopedobacter saltans]